MKEKKLVVEPEAGEVQIGAASFNGLATGRGPGMQLITQCAPKECWSQAHILPAVNSMDRAKC
jgi:hypothetical protein